MAMSHEERKRRQVEQRKRREESLKAKREGRSIPEDPNALLDVEMAAMFWKISCGGAAKRIQRFAREVMMGVSPKGKKVTLLRRSELDFVSARVAEEREVRIARHLQNIKANHHTGKGTKKVAVSALVRPGPGSTGKDRFGRKHFVERPDGMMTISELAAFWYISEAAVRLRVNHYAKEVFTFGKTYTVIIENKEADRIACAVQDAKRVGMRLGGTKAHAMYDGKPGEGKKKEKSRRKVVDESTGQEELSYKRFFARDEGCSWIETSRTRKPGELIKILGGVKNRPALDSYCEDCVSCVRENISDERYVGCLHGMMSLDSNWRHKRGSEMYREKEYEVERVEWAEVAMPTKEDPANAEFFRCKVKRLEMVDLIRREEVRLYEPCPYFRTRIFVDKSAPIDDQPKNWVIDPDVNMDDDSDAGGVPE